MNFKISLNSFIHLDCLLALCFILVRADEIYKDCSKNVAIISSVDGVITALDLDSGLQCWSVLLDSEKFVSSSLSKLKIYENNRRVFLVPSLDGTVYKYDVSMKRISYLPLNVDTLISHSFYLDPSSIINGGKVKIIHAIHRFTGEVIYTCDAIGCINYKTPFPENMLIIEELVQRVNAFDSHKAEKRWHFRVVELKIRIVSQKNVSASMNTNTSKEMALIPHIPQNINALVDLDVYKISLKNGFLGKLNKTNNEFSWIFQASSPVHDAWIVFDDVIELLDPFDDQSGFHTIDMDDGRHSALLFLGTYDHQNFIKKSRKLQLKNPDVTSLSQSIMPYIITIPVCLTENTIPGPHLEADGTDLIPHHQHSSDYGFYFYASSSVAENSTHCILNNTYVVNVGPEIPLSIWLAVVLTTLFVVGAILWLSLLYMPSILQGKSLAVERKSSTGDSTEEFRSRFYQDFELISVLGKGGFGIVMDVKNKIDDCHYAVKRICLHEELNQFQFDKVLREVKALAKLEHRGIVRYFNAWFEYPPAGWQENKDKEANIRDVSGSASQEDDKSASVSVSKNKHSSQKFPKVSSVKPAINKKLRENPMQLFNEDPFFDNMAAEESKFSSYSSFDPKDSSSSSSSEEISCDYSKKHNSIKDTEDSDSFIQFENNNLSLSEKKQFTNEYSSSGKLWRKTNSKNNVAAVQKNSLPLAVSKKHTICYENLKNINRSLIYHLNVETFHVISSFAFCDLTPQELIVEVSDWKHVASSFTKEELIFYQKWLILILCMIRVTENFTCTTAERNLCAILFDINIRLDEGKSFLCKKLTQSAKMHIGKFSSCHREVSNDSSVLSKQCTASKSMVDEEAPIKDVTRGYLYIQMQLCQKESLRDWLNQNCNSRDYNKIMEIFLEIVDAVHYVHSCGLMHRDLKPSNIYFSMEGAIKIGDFGLATSSDIKAENVSSSHTCADVHTSDIGTELYMSPEQKLKQDYDYKTDVYSLGIIFFELLVPFKTYSERCKVLLGVRKLKFPEGFKTNFQVESQLLEQLLENNPQKRPTTDEILEHPALVKFLLTSV